MTFTYDTTVATDLAKFRLELGDTTSPPVLTDEEAAYFLTAGGSVSAGIGLAVDALTLRYARQYDTTIDGQEFKRSQVAAMLEKRSQTLGSERAGAVTQYVTKQDAYSDDIPASDTRAPRSGGSNRASGWDPCGYDLDPDHDIPT